MKFTILYLPLLVVGLTFGIHAQDGKFSRVKGAVTDVYGADISDVRIKAKDANGKIYHAKILNAGSQYEIALPKGIYTILFERSPFTTVEIKGYQTGYDNLQHLDVCLVCGEGCEEIEDIAIPEEQENLQKPVDRGSGFKKPSAK